MKEQIVNKDREQRADLNASTDYNVASITHLYQYQWRPAREPSLCPYERLNFGSLSRMSQEIFGVFQKFLVESFTRNPLPILWQDCVHLPRNYRDSVEKASCQTNRDSQIFWETATSSSFLGYQCWKITTETKRIVIAFVAGISSVKEARINETSEAIWDHRNKVRESLNTNDLITQYMYKTTTRHIPE